MGCTCQWPYSIEPDAWESCFGFGFCSIPISRQQRLFPVSDKRGAFAIHFLHNAVHGTQLPINAAEAELVHQTVRRRFIDVVQKSEFVIRPWIWSAGDEEACEMPMSPIHKMLLICRHQMPLTWTVNPGHWMPVEEGCGIVHQVLKFFPLNQMWFLGNPSHPLECQNLTCVMMMMMMMMMMRMRMRMRMMMMMMMCIVCLLRRRLTAHGNPGDSLECLMLIRAFWPSWWPDLSRLQWCCHFPGIRAIP